MEMVFIICLIIGLVTAFVGSIMGLGGGVILVPTLILFASISDAFAWATPQAIVGISLIVMIFTGLASTLSYLKVKRVDYRTGFLFMIGSIPGGIIGAWLNHMLKQDISALLGILMILIAMILFFKKKEPRTVDLTGKGVRTFEVNGERYQYKVHAVGAIFLALIVGVYLVYLVLVVVPLWYQQ